MDPWHGAGYQQVLAWVPEHVPWNALPHVLLMQALLARSEFHQAPANPGLRLEHHLVQPWTHHHRVLRLSHLQ